MILRADKLVLRRIAVLAIFFSFCSVFLPAAAAENPQVKPYNSADNEMRGYLFDPIPGQSKYNNFLGRYPSVKASGGLPIWCVNVAEPTPGEADVASVDSLTAPTLTAPAGLAVSTAEMAYLMEKYQHSDDHTTLAGIGYLVHLNFELAPKRENPHRHYPNTTAAANVAHLRERVLQVAPFIEDRARELAQEANEQVAGGYQGGSVSGEKEREGKIYSLGITNSAGNYLPGHDITVTLTGSAVFRETGTNTWSGKTALDPISLDWVATGNGEVQASSRITTGQSTLTLLRTNNYTQNTVTIDPHPHIDLVEKEIPGPRWQVYLDFQPLGVSQVVKTSDDGTFTDYFQASANPEYGSGNWLRLSAAGAKKYGNTSGFVPVKYRATAYYIGENLPAQQSTVPKNAEKIGSVDVVANGPSEISANFRSPKPGFATVVWEVLKAEQGDFASFIHDNWADDFAIPAETVSYRYAAQVDTALSIRTTKAGVYFVDDVFISGLPANHGEFHGNERFSADEKYFTQRLYFFPAGLAVLDENLAQAIQIGAEVKIPAQNGFHPSIGANDFRAKMAENGTLTPGTYVFVTSFAGSDRVQPFQTSVTDVHEQYQVSEKPSLHTTLMAAGKKLIPASGTQTLVDQVCYTNLEAGSEYEIHGKLMELPTGNALLTADGKKITAQKRFTATERNGCTTVEFIVDAARYPGIRTVAFEQLFAAGKEIAAHTDLHDANQTVEFTTPEPPPPSTPEKPGVPTEPDPPAELANTGGANIGILIFFIILSLGAGGALLWIRRSRK